MEKKITVAWGGTSSMRASTLPVALLSELCNLLLQLLLCCSCCRLLCVQFLLLYIHSLLLSTALLTHSLQSKPWCLFAPRSLDGIQQTVTPMDGIDLSRADRLSVCHVVLIVDPCSSFELLRQAVSMLYSIVLCMLAVLPCGEVCPKMCLTLDILRLAHVCM